MVGLLRCLLVVVRLSTSSDGNNQERSQPLPSRSSKLQHPCPRCRSHRTSCRRLSMRSFRFPLDFRGDSYAWFHTDCPGRDSHNAQWACCAEVLCWHPRWMLHPVTGLDHRILRQERRRHRKLFDSRPWERRQWCHLFFDAGYLQLFGTKAGSE